MLPLFRPLLCLSVVALLCAVPGAPGAARAEADPLLLPAVVRLEGVGAIYGLVGGVRDLRGERLDVYAARTFGAVEAGGLLVSDVPLGRHVGLNLFAAGVGRARFETSYTRAFAPDAPVRQEVSGAGLGATLDWRPGGGSLRLSLGVARSLVVLEDYATTGGDPIPLPDAHLDDIEATHLLLGVALERTDDEQRPTRGYALGVQAVTFTGRTGQSDAATITTRATGLVPLGGRVTWGLHVRVSDARILRRETRYDTEAEVRARLSVDCTALADPVQRDRCERLAADLAAYIAANNVHGTAAPLGGSTTLRGYRELRFRAAHTRLLSTEVRWRVTDRLEAAPFWEAGYAADDTARLYETGRRDYGLGLRWFLGGLPLRLAAARGEEGTAWFFTAGAAW